MKDRCHTRYYMVARQIAGHILYLKDFDFLAQGEELAYQKYTDSPFLLRLFTSVEQANAQASLLIDETGYFHWVIDAEIIGWDKIHEAAELINKEMGWKGGDNNADRD